MPKLNEMQRNWAFLKPLVEHCRWKHYKCSCLRNHWPPSWKQCKNYYSNMISYVHHARFRHTWLVKRIFTLFYTTLIWAARQLFVIKNTFLRHTYHVSNRNFADTPPANTSDTCSQVLMTRRGDKNRAKNEHKHKINWPKGTPVLQGALFATLIMTHLLNGAQHTSWRPSERYWTARP